MFSAVVMWCCLAANDIGGKLAKMLRGARYLTNGVTVRRHALLLF